MREVEINEKTKHLAAFCDLVSQPHHHFHLVVFNKNGSQEFGVTGAILEAPFHSLFLSWTGKWSSFKTWPCSLLPARQCHHIAQQIRLDIH